jgi:hypothetical protein
MKRATIELFLREFQPIQLQPTKPGKPEWKTRTPIVCGLSTKLKTKPVHSSKPSTVSLKLHLI